MLFSVKRKWGTCTGQRVSPQSVSPTFHESIITVATVKFSSIIVGTIGGVVTEMMLDSGSAVSLIHQTTLSQLEGAFKKLDMPSLNLVTTSGDSLLIIAHLLLPVVIGENNMIHNFVVVSSLVVPVILGVDFLQTHGVQLDFSTTPVKIDTTKMLDTPPTPCRGFYSGHLSGRTNRKDHTISYRSFTRCQRCSRCMCDPMVQSRRCNRATTFFTVQTIATTIPTSLQVLTRQDQSCTTLHPYSRFASTCTPRRIPAHYKTQIQEQI